MFYKCLIISLFSFLSLLQADYITEYKMGDEVQKFMYRDASHLKMTNRADKEKSEIYRIGKKVYIVTGEEGKRNIVDVDEMRAMSKAMGFDSSQYAKEAQKEAKEQTKDYKIVNTGKKVKVGGVKGEVFVIKGTYKGKAYKQEFVLTNNKEVVKSVRAMFSLFGAMVGMDNSESVFEIKKGFVTIKSDDMELKSFKSKKVAKSEYELPKDAKKQEMPTYQKTSKPENKDSGLDMLKSFF